MTVSTLASGLVGTAAGGSFDDGVVAAAAGYNTAVYNALKFEDSGPFVKGVFTGMVKEVFSADLWQAIGQVVTDPKGTLDAIRSMKKEDFMAIMENGPVKDFQNFRQYIEKGGEENVGQAGEIVGRYMVQAGLVSIGVGGTVFVGKKVVGIAGRWFNSFGKRRIVGQIRQETRNVVYHSVEAGITRYVGITNDFARRSAEHLAKKGIKIEPLMKHLSRSDARAVEQALIEIHGLGKNGGTLLNRINSISLKNPAYGSQVQRGYELLKSIGYY